MSQKSVDEIRSYFIDTLKVPEDCIFYDCAIPDTDGCVENIAVFTSSEGKEPLIIYRDYPKKSLPKLIKRDIFKSIDIMECYTHLPLYLVLGNAEEYTLYAQFVIAGQGRCYKKITNIEEYDFYILKKFY